QQVEEMFLTLLDKSGKEIPVLINASLMDNQEEPLITCVIIPIRKRSEYENELLLAKKVAEKALKEKNETNKHLKNTLEHLKEKEQNLLKANKQNQKFKR